MTAPETTQEQQAWTPDDSSFGARLALVRQRMGWGNVKEAATQCGVPVESWRRWERDGILPSRLVTICVAIATRTGCDLDWLLRGPMHEGRQPSGRYGEQHVIARIAPAAEGSSVWAAEPPERIGQWDRSVRQTRPTFRDTRRPHKAMAR